MPERLRESFEHAFYLQLVGVPYRDAMVQCGVEALIAGADGPNVVRLAGADDADEDELRALFRSSAREVGVALPSVAEEPVWRLRRTEVMERTQRDRRAVQVRSPERVFDDRVYLIRRSLMAATPTPELTAFLRQLDSPRDDYQRWLDRLAELAQHVVASTGVPARVVAGLTNVLAAQSFGATSQAHLDALSRLMVDLGEPCMAPSSS